jgi:hypothetical protein
MATLTLLLPARDRLESAGMPATLACWLARGNRLAGRKQGRDAALRECFEFTGTRVPAAALTRSMDAGDARGPLWLRADPCHVAVDAVAVRMLACGTVNLSTEECAELARALRPLFGDAGFPLEPATPERWYLRCPHDARVPQFAAPEDVLGDDLMRHLPQGENEHQWRYLLNESQVILHNHPVNERRVAHGRMPANSLWFWGAGKLPEWVRASFTRVLSSDDVVIGLARLAKIATSAPTPDAIVRMDVKDVLLDLADQRDVQALERDWFAPLNVALRHRRLTELHLRFDSGERAAIKPVHRWRFWRRIPSTR